ncbi:MAG: hypothetical protein WBD49_15940, partial [Bradyrhizobium sp.]
VSQSLQTVKVGLNYKFGQDINARWQPSESDYHLRGTTDTPFIPEAQVEVGGVPSGMRLEFGMAYSRVT